MKKFRSDKRGQFVIIAALLIAVLTLSMAVSIHELSSNRRKLAYEPLDELLLAVTSDLERALTYALSNASRQYNYAYTVTPDSYYAQQQGNLSGNLNMQKWQRSVLASYPQLGIDLKFREPPTFSFQWGSPSGFTQADLPFYELDVAAYNFRGWTGRSYKYVSLVINDFTYINASYSALNFRLTQFITPDALAAPIPNLTTEDVTVWANVDAPQAWPEGTPDSVQYLGGGNYRLVFENPIEGNPRAAKLMISTPGDEILVSASMTSSVSVTLHSQRRNSPLDEDPSVTIEVGSVGYSMLPQIITDWQSLQPGLRCIFSNMNYYFISWGTTGDIILADPNDWQTTVTRYGNGTITAIYDIQDNPPPGTVYKLEINSRLDGSNTSTNLGSIVYDSTPYILLPANPPTSTSQDHTVVYTPQSGFTFARWEYAFSSPPWIRISPDEFNSSANIRLFGNGTLTAIYQQRTIVLDSDEYNGTTSHLGNVIYGGLTYGLPTTLLTSNATVANGLYTLTFTPFNESYQFMWWNITGDIFLYGPNASSTSIRVEGNGNINATYAYMTDSPSSTGGTFFVDAIPPRSKEFWLIPIPPEKDGHLASKVSTGSGKANLTIISSPIPASITCERIVSVTAYIGIDPGNAPLRTLEFELGFIYGTGGTNYCRLGYWAFTITGSPDTRYYLTADVSGASFPGDLYVIPTGSRVFLNVTATFTTPPGGTIKLFYGPKQPSCITLFH